MEKSIIVNKNMFHIVTCCASCKYMYYKGLQRRCEKKPLLVVENHGLCDDYQISDWAMNEGKLNNRTTI